MNRLLRFAGPLFALAVFALAIWALRRELRHIHYHDVRDALLNIPRWDFAVAIALTALNYVVLLAYDWVSVRYLRLPLGMGKTALASFIGHVSSFNFGAVLGGTPVRYRLYTAFGLSGGDILKLIALSTATFWIGFLALAGLMFLWDPLPLPAELHMPFSTTTPIGLGLIAFTLAYLALSYARVTLRWRDWEFTLPPLWLSLVQLVIAATDLLIASAVLYVLLPKSLGITFGAFLAIYLLAVVTVLFTHVPAGAGVLEFVVLLLLAPSKPAAVLGSILAFRVVYYLLPLALAMILLAGHEIAIRRHAVGRLTTAVGRWAPAVGAAAVVGRGVVGRRVAAVGRCDAGCSWPPGVAQRNSAAWRHRGVAPVGERVRPDAGDSRPRIAVAARQCLLAFRNRADRRDSLLAGAGSRRRASRAAGGGARGPLALSALLLSPCGPAARAVFARLAGGDRRHHHRDRLADRLLIQTRRIFQSIVVEVRAASRTRPDHCVPEWPSLWRWSCCRWLTFCEPCFRSPTRRMPTKWAGPGRSSPPRAARLNNLALTGDKWFLFNASHTAFVMYRVHQRLWIALGDPVGPAAERTEMAWQFRDLSEHYGGSIAFCDVDQENVPLYLDMGLWLLQLGEEARVRLSDFSLAGPRRAVLAQTHDKLGETCRFEVVPAAEVPPLIDRLRVVSDAYLVARHATEHGFLSGFFDPHYLAQFPVALVHSENRVVAFANLWPTATREELAVDLLRDRRPRPRAFRTFSWRS